MFVLGDNGRPATVASATTFSFARAPSISPFTHAHLAIRSNWPASKLMRFAVSIEGGTLDFASKFEVLLFLASEAYSEVYRELGWESKWGSSGREPERMRTSAVEPMGVLVRSM